MVKRKRGGRKQKSNALLTDIRQKDAEAAPTRRRRTAALLPVSEPRKPSTRRAALQSENTPTATPTPEPEAEPRKRRARNTAKVAVAEEDEANNDEEVWVSFIFSSEPTLTLSLGCYAQTHEAR